MAAVFQWGEAVLAPKHFVELRSVLIAMDAAIWQTGSSVVSQKPRRLGHLYLLTVRFQSVSGVCLDDADICSQE